MSEIYSIDEMAQVAQASKETSNPAVASNLLLRAKRNIHFDISRITHFCAQPAQQLMPKAAVAIDAAYTAVMDTVRSIVNFIGAPLGVQILGASASKEQVLAALAQTNTLAGEMFEADEEKKRTGIFLPGTKQPDLDSADQMLSPVAGRWQRSRMWRKRTGQADSVTAGEAAPRQLAQKELEAGVDRAIVGKVIGRDAGEVGAKIAGGMLGRAAGRGVLAGVGSLVALAGPLGLGILAVGGVLLAADLAYKYFSNPAGQRSLLNALKSTAADVWGGVVDTAKLVGHIALGVIEAPIAALQGNFKPLGELVLNVGDFYTYGVMRPAINAYQTGEFKSFIWAAAGYMTYGAATLLHKGAQAIGWAADHPVESSVVIEAAQTLVDHGDPTKLAKLANATVVAGVNVAIGKRGPGAFDGVGSSALDAVQDAAQRDTSFLPRAFGSRFGALPPSGQTTPGATIKSALGAANHAAASFNNRVLNPVRSSLHSYVHGSDETYQPS